MVDQRDLHGLPGLQVHTTVRRLGDVDEVRDRHHGDVFRDCQAGDAGAGGLVADEVVSGHRARGFAVHVRNLHDVRATTAVGEVAVHGVRKDSALDEGAVHPLELGPVGHQRGADAFRVVRVALGALLSEAHKGRNGRCHALDWP